jgi:hypothetical protein
MDHFNNYEELKEVNPTFYPRPRVVRQEKKRQLIGTSLGL